MHELKPGWRLFKFGNMVTSMGATRKARGWTPAEGGVQRYVGLEHLDSGSLKIRRWGSPDAVGENSDLRHFEPGDVILARRGIELRKVGVAEFRGVASGHALVFRANPEIVLPEYLPFLMQSDTFMLRADRFSVGSLSRTVNLSALVKEEFALPPLEEQRRAAVALSAARDASEKVVCAAAAAEQVFAAMLEFLFSRGVGEAEPTPVRGKYLSHPATWRVLRLDELARVERGMFTHRPRNLPEFFGGPYPFVQTGDVAASRGSLSSASQRLSEVGVTYSKAFPPGSILLTIAAVIGATAITTEDTWCPDSVVGIIPTSTSVNVRFLEYALRRLRPFLEFHEATQTAQKNINLQNLRPLPVAIPTRRVQDEVVERLGAVESQIATLHQQRLAINKLVAHLADALIRGDA